MKATTIAVTFTVLLVSLHIAGAFFPGSLNWGYHLLGFFPRAWIPVYAAAAIALIVFMLRPAADTLILRVARVMDLHPARFLSFVLATFAVTSFAMAVSSPLLGDGMYIVKQFSGAVTHEQALDLRREPFATHFFFALVTLMGSPSYRHLVEAFQAGGLILGAGFIVNTFCIARYAFTDIRTRLLAFAAMLVPPYVIMFFGYVEMYSLVLFALSAYVLSAIAHLKHRLPLVVVSVMFVLLSFTHIIGVLLFPSLAYVVYRAIKRKEYHSAGIASLAAIALAFTAIALTGYDPRLIFSQSPHRHYLPISPSSNVYDVYSEAYTLFSIYHINDLFNWITLLAPWVACCLFVLMSRGKKIEKGPEVELFLLLSVIPVMGFWLIAKFDLGAARDWDVFAAWMFPLILLTSAIFLNSDVRDRIKIFGMVIAIAALNSGFWISLNSSESMSIQRFRSLFDKRNVSPLGYYTGYLHLASYLHQVKRSIDVVPLWEEFTSIFPHDRRGYMNVITNLELHERDADWRIDETYRRWLRWIPGDSSAGRRYAERFLDRGTSMLTAGRMADAESQFRRALDLDRQSPRALNNLGAVLAEKGEVRPALDCFRQAIGLDSAYADAWYNLANAMLDIGYADLALTSFRRAADLGNTQARDLITKAPPPHTLIARK